MLNQIPYEHLKRKEIELPKRQRRGDYSESQDPFKVIPEPF